MVGIGDKKRPAAQGNNYENGEPLGEVVSAEFDRLNKQLNKQYSSIMDGTALVAGRVEVLSVHIDNHGDKIEKLEGKVDGLEDKVDNVNNSVSKLPHEWNKDIDSKIDSYRQDRNQVSQVIDLALERKQATAKPKSIPPPKNNNNFRLLAFFQPLLPYILLGLAGLGAYIAARTWNSDESVQINDAVKAIQEVEKKIKKISEQPTSKEHYND
jgi:chromosome segregation ATPase